MGIFSSGQSGPVFIKETSSTDDRLRQLEEIRDSLPPEKRSGVEKDIKLLSAGRFGEENILFELKNSHLPLYVIRDLYLEHQGLTAQIDFLILTPKRNFVVECKNLIGNIEINERGDFIRTFHSGKQFWKEGIYSPLTQNRRHLNLLREIGMEQQSNFVSRTFYHKSFENLYRPIVVLANSKTLLKASQAPLEIRNQVIRLDHMIHYIEWANSQPGWVRTLSRRELESTAEFWLSQNKPVPPVRVEKYLQKLSLEEPAAPSAREIPQAKPFPGEVSQAEPEPEMPPKCPRCGAPMVKRVATKGERAGRMFWGCSGFPKCKGIINLDEQPR